MLPSVKKTNLDILADNKLKMPEQHKVAVWGRGVLSKTAFLGGSPREAAAGCALQGEDPRDVQKGVGPGNWL